MTIVLKLARPHGYRLSTMSRSRTTSIRRPLAISLPLGLPRLGVDLPRVALDPSGGDGALQRWMDPFGVDWM